jgi:hypothetical protein
MVALGQPVQPETVQNWINTHRRAYLDKPVSEGAEWISVVNAPELLYDLFNAVSDAKVEFQKTRHSVALTEWLLANKPDTLDELLDFVRTLIA